MFVLRRGRGWNDVRFHKNNTRLSFTPSSLRNMEQLAVD